MTFERATATALRMIEKYGQGIIFRKIITTDVIDAKPWDIPSSYTLDYPSAMAFFTMDSSDPYYKTQSWSKTDGVTTTGLVKAYMGAVNFEPSLGDVIVRAGKVYSIVSIDKLAPNVETILYTFILKE